jgi:uncharacterized protein (DUF2267 family)
VTLKNEHGAGPGSNRVGQTTSGFLQQIQHTGLLRSTVEASEFATAVLCTLLLAIPRERATKFLASVPAPLRDLLHACAVQRADQAEIVGRVQALETIAVRLRIEPDQAMVAARVVLGAAQTWLPHKDLEQLRLE